MSDLVPVGSTGATRLGGSARAAAAVVALVLVAVVWLGASGRQPQPPLAAQSVDITTPSPARTQVSAAARTATPTSGDVPSRTTVPPISPSPLVAPIPLGEDALAVIVHDSDRPRGYLGILHETSQGVLQASVRMAAEPTGSGPITIQLAQLWTRGDGPPFATIETFEIPRHMLLGAPHGTTLVDATARARADRRRAPRLVRRGYNFRVEVERRDEQLYLVATLTVGAREPRRGLSNPSAATR